VNRNLFLAAIASTAIPIASVHSSVHAQCAYDAIWVQPEPGFLDSAALDLGSNGDVVGFRLLESTIAQVGFRWNAKSGFQALPAPPGGAQEWRGARINSKGMIAGEGDLPGIASMHWQLLSWSPSNASSVVPPQTPVVGYQAYGITDAGMIVGTLQSVSVPSIDYPVPVIVKDNALQPLPKELQGCFGYLYAASDTGWIGGARFIDPGAQEAFLWDGLGAVAVLPPVPQGLFFPRVGSVSNDGRAVVRASTLGYQSRSFVWWQGRYTHLQAPAGFDMVQANGINTAGQVVGLTRLQSDPQNGYVFLWQDGVFHNLSTLTSVPSNAVLKQASEILDDGRILCAVTWPGYQSFAVLTPQTRSEDVTLDCKVDVKDLSVLFERWGPVEPMRPTRADVDGDGEIGPYDLAAVLGAWSPR
jgi:probable HAF family extracellular repeat protein